MIKKIISGIALLLITTFSTAQNREDVLKTMKKATTFMMDVVSYQGGFVWNYLPDFSRSWGELEAKRTMIWIQPPGTPTVGHTLIDAYHATKDEYYYEAAMKVASALIKGQLPCGGWNYMFDMAGEDSLKKWYETIGKNAWRLEEFQHYYGNATFDDAGTIHAGKFMLRLYLIKKDPEIKASLEKVISFVLTSQYPQGGWPQRFPLVSGFNKNGLADYTGFITLNDDVLMENIEFLTLCYQCLKRKELKEPIIRALYCCKNLQQPQPYSGWSDQYTLDMKPAHARSYEPRAVNTSTTANFIYNMMNYFKMTGDTSFLTGIPAAIKFIENQKLPESEVILAGKTNNDAGTSMFPRFVDPENGKPLYVHRKGSNVENGKYYTDQNIAGTIAHYSSQTFLNPGEIRKNYEEVKKLSVEEATKDSPFGKDWGPPPPLIQPFKGRISAFPAPKTEQIVNSLNSKGYWPSKLNSTSNPYLCDATSEGGDTMDFAQTMSGDIYDTSCFRERNGVECISTTTYLNNMGILIQYLVTNN